jgi:hypothetical protein
LRLKESPVRWLKYVAKAFNARPFGMPSPPFWFAAIAVGLLGYFLNPAFYLIGGGAVLFCAGLIASSRRFQNAVDAANQPPAPDDHALLLKRLDQQGQQRQAKLEQQCAELQRVLESAKAGEEHIRGVWRLAELHLRLLSARSAADAVLDSHDGEPGKHLPLQIKELKQRLSQLDIDKDLRETLEDQAKILDQRMAIQAEAGRRRQVLDAELDRIGEQMALIREQALMTSDPAAIRRSVDALSTFLSESGRWLQDQEAIFGDLDAITPDPFGAGPAQSQNWQRARGREREQE